MKYQMPAEWAPHERTLIEWPVKASLIHPENYEMVCRGYAAVIQAILAFEPVTVIANPGDKSLIKKLCKMGEKPLEIVEVPHNDAWCRDNGPTFVYKEDGKRLGVDWVFNAWGEKYIPYDLDDAMAGKLLEKLNIERLRAPIILEGGSIHVDGEGTLLSTEECLLNPNRNPKLDRSSIESIVSDYLGISKFIWLEKGLEGDETDGHVDNVACFAKPGLVLLQTCRDPEDANYARSRAHLRALRSAFDAVGRRLEVIEIPQPPARYENGERLTLSYLNFYLVNGGLILPVFGGDAIVSDDAAEAILKRVFPERKIVKVDGMPLIREGGNVHCITQQMPLRKESQ